MDHGKLVGLLGKAWEGGEDLRGVLDRATRGGDSWVRADPEGMFGCDWKLHLEPPLVGQGRLQFKSAKPDDTMGEAYGITVDEMRSAIAAEGDCTIRNKDLGCEECEKPEGSYVNLWLEGNRAGGRRLRLRYVCICRCGGEGKQEVEMEDSTYLPEKEK